MGDRSAAPESTTIAVEGAAGECRAREIALHRGRVALEHESEKPWSLTFDPLPVVAVRRMWGEGLEDMAASAEEVRDHPAVVLDLRANGGGSDNYGVRWFAGFSGEDLRTTIGAGHFRAGQTTPSARWDSAILGRSEAKNRGLTALLAPRPYAGRLFVLTDAGTGSAGECFTALASQIGNVLILGENTAGCMTYGNVDRYSDLPHGQFRVVVPSSMGVLAGRAFREGFGFFPDYWLDTDDPLSAIVELCTREGWRLSGKAG